ncbi:hypothetical protein BCR35DRAFT_308328 [Leucosporidium creatinivorum]|uniref:FAD/NAD(P)-binding domain-containing protein n=1 Tax=Leucosporidium creatinivorum TaxID=106004 RepID=A0A1Y2E9I0_9BASI|nr:hypothetical protein BCR35DRAFT_308328 [Leucosporidium creatinivorum]
MPSSASSRPSPIKNVVVLGGSYAGGRAAEVLSKVLPEGYRVVLVDRQSHFNHLYLFPRVGVVPGHANKVFVPFTNFFNSPALPPPATLPPPSLTDPKTTIKGLKSTYVHAGVTKIGEGFIEVDKDLGVEVTGEEAEPVEEVDEEEVAKLGEKLENLGMTEEGSSRRRIPYEFLVYALGCKLPPPLVTPARTKKAGVAHLEAQTKRIAEASSILIAGAGALGIQYASDIADLYNNPENAEHRPEGCVSPKKITIVHSRDRFLPLYKQEVHDEVYDRLTKLGVDVVLGERLALPSVEEELKVLNQTRTITTKAGKEIEYDLLMRCTGQSPNSALLGEFIPEALNEWGFVKVQSTTQVDAGESTRKTDNIYVVGDVADANVIKAGHTGWNQAEITIQNIMSSVMCNVKGSDTEGQEPTMAHYKPSPPQIKVTLGLRNSCSELLPEMDAKETIIAKKDDGPIDNYWSLIWSRMGISTEDLTV